MLEEPLAPPRMLHHHSLESLESLATVSIRDHAGSRRRLHVDMPRSVPTSVTGTSLSGSTISSPPADYASPSDYVQDWVYRHRGSRTPLSRRSPSTDPEANTAQQKALTQRWHLPFSPEVLSSTSSLYSHPAGLDAPQVGIDFVLCLEHVCLKHMCNPSKAKSSGGHALTAQAPLLLHAPKDIKGNSKWQVPVSEIDRLLQSKSGFKSCGEVTPVQVWGRLKSHPGFQNWDKNDLKGFQAKLMKEVRCHGFGAVIDEYKFEKMLQGAFATSPKG